jgi:hypothetical protein
MALELEQPAVVRRAHAAWTEPHGMARVVSSVTDALAHDAPGDAEQSRDPCDVDLGGRDTLVGIDRTATQLRHHEVPWQSVHVSEFPKHADHRLIRLEPAALKQVPKARAQRVLIQRQYRDAE